ncbi:methyl-accepting chemotaxis protein [Cohnella mopanensis]|uniref:methyl-accepting chemotaxis protein n=1 Tax=Cohnella mopanensis TaxID=2911966 RepID=UPI001EF95704|nr:methyl-accepting chemotaxis protein [Cohnella mopanensis]
MLYASKNKLMTQLAFAVVLLSVVTLFVYQNHQTGHHGTNMEDYRWLTRSLFAVPLIFMAISVYLFIRRKAELVPLFNTITLTFASISIISGAEGRVEFHFSIFMVLAIIAYYESVSLILVSTGIFAVQHLGAAAFLPEVVFGDHEYSFSMVLVHALFLVFTSASTIVQVISKKRHTALLEQEKQQKEQVISQTTEQVRDTSHRLVQIVDTLSYNSDKSMTSVGEVAASIAQVSGHADNQAISSVESARAMEEMAMGIQKIAESATRVADASVEMVASSDQGNESIHSAIAQFDRIKESSGAASEAAADLKKHTEQINGIVEVIADISKQTNMLALNAAIEASRAGEFGRGFGVVAGEVRKLAAQSNDSARQIADLIEQVQISTELVVKLMSEGMQEVERGGNVVQQAGQSFAAILERAQAISDQISDISSASEQMSAGSEQVMASIEEISRSSGNVASQVSTISSSSRDQSTSMEEISQSIRNVNQLVQSLDKLAGQLSK